MKSTYSRRYRRRSPASREAAVAKKDNQQEQPFFSPASPQSFFKPNAVIQRKCDKCEAEDKNVKRLGDKKEEEKPVQKMDEKKRRGQEYPQDEREERRR